MAIIGILLNIAVAGYNRLIDDAQNQKTADNLKASLAQARSEAITHGGNVRVCGSNDGNTCTNSFNAGWLSYYDIDIDATLTNADTILAWHEVDYNGTRINATNSDDVEITHFGFNYRGYPVLPIELEVFGRTEDSTLQIHANGRVEIQ